ncbi:MAG: 3-deoxy-7-phosphoheptulonate synthase [Roseovarius sp.]|nr:3-deoxy-7-phosphoheptulonate synthase [Roseovarius sp.]
MTADDLKRLMAKLNPENEAGRLTLIARFGAGKVGEHLPRLIRTVRGGGRERASGPATRCTATRSSRPPATRPGPSSSVLREVQRVLRRPPRPRAPCPAACHFEMTGQDVTECTGGVRAVTDEDLSDRYHTACDPRLNASQSLELAFLVAEELSGLRERMAEARAV